MCDGIKYPVSTDCDLPVTAPSFLLEANQEEGSFTLVPPKQEHHAQLSPRPTVWASVPCVV